MPDTKIALKQIDSHFLNSSQLIAQSLPLLRAPVVQAARLIARSIDKGGKLMICGNGGSAAESQHFASELVGRYLKERKALPAIALTTDTSALTAIGNDYGFDKVFSRQVEAYAQKGDVLFCISTSGNSANILKAAKLARLLKVITISLTGHDGGKLKALCDVNLIVPSANTPYIQEVHLVIIHTICDIIESFLKLE